MIFTRGILQRAALRSARALHRSSAFSSKDNVDSKEVDHFAKLGEDWLNPEGPMKPLFAMNDLRIPFVRDGLINMKNISEDRAKSPHYLRDIKILDVGCGGGILSLPLARLGADVTGLDPTPNLIQIAQANTEKTLPGAKVRFIEGTIEEHSATCSEHYDVLVCSEVVEHVPNKQSFLTACVAAVKPGGSLFFTTIAQTPAAWLAAIVMAEYILRALPLGTHEYDKLITSKDLSCHLKEANCNVVTINGMLYNPFTCKWSWHPIDAVSYALHAVKRFT